MAEMELFPKEVISNVPRITITGDERVHIEQHRGLVTCQTNEVCFHISGGFLKIRGEALSLGRYTGAEAVLTGKICTISLEKEGGRV